MNNNDHYVPQFLLRQFCNGDGRLHVFDKWKQRSFVSSTRNVASERGFYDINLDNEIVSFEPILCSVEQAALSALNSVVENNSLAVLSAIDRVNVAYFLAIQALRTRGMRETLAQMDEGLRETMPSKGISPEQLPENFFRTDEQIKADSIFYLNLANDFLPHFLKKDWCLNAAYTGTTFFISDDPVVRRNIYPSTSLMGNNGIACEGIQIYLPLSSNLTLCLLCPTIAEQYRLKQAEFEEATPILEAIKTGRAFMIPAECVTYCNSLQVANSGRFLFSCNDDFSLAKDMLSSHPELRRPKRIAVE